jgi:hypothetical protein
MARESYAVRRARQLDEPFVRKQKLSRATTVILVSLPLVFMGSFIGELITRLIESPAPKVTLEQKIDILTDNLKASQKVISEIESEVGQRTQLVEKLRKDAETAQQLATINHEQSEAVAQALEGKLKQGESGNF